MNLTEQINQKFAVTCKDCISDKTIVDFYSGFIHANGGDTGSLSIACLNCGNKIDVESA